MSVPSDELQVILYMPDNSRRVVRGTESKVRPVVNAILNAAPAASAYRMEDTNLSNTATLVDPRTPPTPNDFIGTYGNNHVYVP